MILGNEIYLCRNGLSKENYISGEDRFWHFILLAKDARGHEQIREISTRAWLRSWKQGRMKRVPTYYQDLIDIIDSDRDHVIGSTACFLPGQKVKTRLGEKNIEEITENDEILTKDGRWEKINFPTSRLYEGQGQILDFSKEPDPIYCTANHQFLTYDFKTKTTYWIEAKDLKKNDKCLEPLLPIKYTNNTVLDIEHFDEITEYRLRSHGQNYSNNIFRLPEKIQITSSLMRLFGLWLADGHISLHKEYYKYNIGFTFSGQEFEIFYNSFVKQGLQDLGLSEQDYSIRYRPENHRVDLDINKVEVCLLFKNIFGISHAQNKFIPERLKNINYDLNIELFFGYFLGDGYFRYRKSQGGELVAASISYQLIKDFEQLGLAIDLSGSITISQKRIDKNNTTHQESYYLTYSNAFLGKNLNKNEPFTHEEIVKLFKQGAQKKGAFADIVQIENTRYRIKKVKSNKSFMINERVYCLNTNSHSFVLNNVIVHNCLGGYIPHLILDNRIDEAKNWLLQMKRLFGEGNFYLEMQPPAKKGNEQDVVNHALYELSTELNIPYIITTDSHYLTKSDATIHKAYLNSQDGEREVDSFYATTYMMSTEELESYFKDSQEMLQEAYKNIQKIADSCEDYDLTKPLRIPELKWKTFSPKGAISDWYGRIPFLKLFVESDYEGDKRLAQAIVERLEWDKTLNNDKTYAAIDECLDMTWKSSIVNKTHWSAYYLNLQNIIDTCWEAGSLVGPGRGSGVGFILLYVLNITQINPLRETTPTYPWRFLNPSRVSVLDVDFDIEGGRRGLVLAKLREVYGSDRMANVATFGTEKSKAAIQTACRGLGIDVDEAQYIASLIPADRGITRTLHQCYYGDEGEDWKPVGPFVREMNEHPELWKVAQKIEGLVCRVG